MRKECKTLHAKAVDSLVLAVDHFNRAWDRGRTEAVLILASVMSLYRSGPWIL